MKSPFVTAVCGIAVVIAAPSCAAQDVVGPVDGAGWASTFQGATWTDNGRWRANGGTNHNTYLQVFDNSLDPDVPGGRGLRTIGTNGDSFWNVMQIVSPPRVPNVGESILWRWYYKPIKLDGDGDYHPIDWGTGQLNSGPNFAVLKFVKWNGLWQPQIEIQGAPSQWYATSQPILQEDQWYRFEVSWNRTATSSWTVDYRIYNAAGVQIVDTDDMLGNFGTETGRTLAAAAFNNSNAARSTMLEIGSPGVGGLAGSPHEAERYAAIAAIVGPRTADVPFDAARGW